MAFMDFITFLAFEFFFLMHEYGLLLIFRFILFSVEYLLR